MLKFGFFKGILGSKMRFVGLLLAFSIIVAQDLPSFEANNSSQNATTPINQQNKNAQSPATPTNKANDSEQSAANPTNDAYNDEQSAISSSSNGREYMYKTIIRLYRPDKVELIDLHQIGNEAKPDRVLFDSSEELKKNNIYLQYEDTDEDVILMMGFNKILNLELNLSTNGEEFLKSIFTNFIENANQDKTLQLLNSLANARYDSPKNFARLTNSKLYERLDASKLLNLETSYDRMYVKTPEFILLVLVDDCYFSQRSGGWWIFRRTSEFVSFKTRYKLYSLKEKKVLKSRRFNFSFAIEPSQQKYEFIAQKAGERLKTHLADVVKSVR